MKSPQCVRVSCGNKGHFRKKCKHKNAVCDFCQGIGHVIETWHKRNIKGNPKRKNCNDRRYLEFQEVKTRLGRPWLSKHCNSYHTANNSLLPVIGSFLATAKENYLVTTSHKIEFLITKFPSLNLIGVNTINELKISVDSLIINNISTDGRKSQQISPAKEGRKICYKYPNIW
ncbi:hypothetical protein RF11_07940 [Thelohanellus kitauei]|uniref:CCHC-type domain-containing protein n=1 Tax=Thelohanellus kitauei TaxID=669202 RepID=A0A0C2MF47_THEKT|nr:hypothetical protein RF11_07940 [Thelohanellus kitauei]